MTNRAIIVLAVAATAFLAVGARLLESPTPLLLVLAAAALVLGTALAATAVAAAWRPVEAQSPRPGSDAGPT